MYQRQQSQPLRPQADPSKAKDLAVKKGKPFCKVCFDAGKSDSEYTSHYVKSAPSNGVVTCPTLLNQSCRKCGQNGHTSGYCDERCDEAKMRPQENHRSNPTNPIIVLSGAPPPIGAEAELKILSSTFKSKSKSIQNEFPVLPSNKSNKVQPFNKAPEAEAESDAHVYNPRSNAFGALSNPNPKQNQQKSFQPPTQSQTTQSQTTQSQPQQSQPQQSQPQQSKPLTMADRLKNPAPKPTAIAKVIATVPIKLKFADMPPKSQFWWQDEVD